MCVHVSTYCTCTCTVYVCYWRVSIYNGDGELITDETFDKFAKHACTCTCTLAYTVILQCIIDWILTTSRVSTFQLGNVN